MLKRSFSFALFLCLAISADLLGAEQTKTANLPLNRIVLFNSGVGFFEHSGKVDGNVNVEMKFKTDQINDLLKSMVVQDLDGGRISTVNYGSKDPISKTLKTFSIDLTENPTLADLLGQVRGERVELEAPSKISGLILGIEIRKKQIGENTTIETEILNILTDTGFRAVPMESISSLRLTNEKLDAELRKALALLASAHATDKKDVELSFTGNGQRRVRVGYIQESPVWKTTYRLVLGDEKLFLQGWAIVENTTDTDWNNVNLSLVSGRPISYVMDLYQPMYVPRPEVKLDLFASLRPQTYGQDLVQKVEEFQPPMSAVAGNFKIGDKLEERFGGSRSELGVASLGASTTRSLQKMGRAYNRERVGFDDNKPAEEQQSDMEVMFSHSVQSAAKATELGSLFQYKIDTPVSLPRQQSAMLPIVTADVKGEKVSIYNQIVHAKHPLAGLQFTNTTDLHLMQGPITVFDSGAYAGDAKIEDLPPSAQRLISYSVDLDTEVAPQSKAQPEELLSVQLLKGTMIVTRKYVRGKEYTVKTSGKEPKKVLIEYPLDASWKLVKPEKPSEKTRDLYRFAVDAKPGVPVTMVVEEERTAPQQLTLSSIDDNWIQFYINAKVVSDKVKDALREIVKRKAELSQLLAKKQQTEQRVREIGDDQARIRQNMAQLDRNSDIYKNYLKKFDKQETDIEALRAQIADQSAKETELRKSLDTYMLSLDLQ